MKQVFRITVVVLALATLCGCSNAPEKLGEQSILTTIPEVTPTVWSAPVTNAETALRYRFGVVRSDIDITPGKLWECPIVIEVTNTGKTPMDLDALELFQPPSLIRCKFYVDGERVGNSPVVGDAVDSHITLKPGERLSRTVMGGWSVKAEGKMDLAVSFGVLVKTEGNERDPLAPKFETRELRTAPLPIKFVKVKQRKTDRAKRDM